MTNRIVLILALIIALTSCMTAPQSSWPQIAEQDLSRAQYNLGVAYETGDGVPRNYREAVRLYRFYQKIGRLISEVTWSVSRV
jgi:TPR repeat protein